MLNRVILVGRLVQDPEIRYTQSKATRKLYLAVNRPFLNQQGAGMPISLTLSPGEGRRKTVPSI